MGRSTLKGPAAYSDITPMLYEALQKGAQVNCGTVAAAVKLVQRMNQFRIMDRKLNYEKQMRRELPQNDIYRAIEIRNRENLLYLKSIYDVLIFKRRESVVIIERRPPQPWISITDLEGNPIEVPPYDFVDPYVEMANAELNRESFKPVTTEELMRQVEERKKHNLTKPLNLMDGDKE